MIIDFSEKLESIQNDKRKKEIVCQCVIESFIAVTQEVNSILMILKSEGINPNDIAYFVEGALILLLVKDPKTVPSLAALHLGAPAQVLVQLADIISDRTLADAEFLCDRGDGDTRSVPQYLQYIRRSVVRKLFAHVSVSPMFRP